MQIGIFEEPVSIIVGLGIPVQVGTVAEAYAILSEWPVNQRGPAHDIALKACRAALAGEIDADTARGTFAAFAARSGILTPDDSALVAARARGALGRHLPA